MTPASSPNVSSVGDGLILRGKENFFLCEVSFDHLVFNATPPFPPAFDEESRRRAREAQGGEEGEENEDDEED